MKNIINYLGASLISLSSFIAFGQDTTNNALTRYARENKEVYNDFLDLVSKKGEGNKEYSSTYTSSTGDFSASVDSKPSNSMIILRIKKDGEIKDLANLKKGEEIFVDRFANGFNEGENDSYFSHSARGSISSHSSAKQLELAKHYTEKLKEIMHKEGYKSY